MPFKFAPMRSTERSHNWRELALKRLFRIVNGSTPKSDEPAYWDGDIPWVTPDDLGALKAPELTSTQRLITQEGYRSCGTTLVPAGTLIVSTRAPIGYIAIAATTVCTNQGCKSLVPSGDVSTRFFYYQLIAAEKELVSHGQGSTFSELAATKLGAITLLLPPRPEQDAIAAFLDNETARIDALVAKKERLLRLLEEKRTALITNAVTKGLDPSVGMKESGVEWLGEVPAHWKSLSLARISISRCDGPFGSGLKSEHYTSDGVRVVRLQNVGAVDFMDGDAAFINPTYAATLGDHGVLPYDLLIAGLGDDRNPVGRACVAPSNLGPAIVKADCFRFRLDRRVANPRFIAYQLSATARSSAAAIATGATRERVNLGVMSSRALALPPLQEQETIAARLDEEGVHSNAVVTRINRAIALLREYRTALISAAVTGQIDVSGGVDGGQGDGYEGLKSPLGGGAS